MIAVEVSGAIDSLLRQKLGRGNDFVLADYFDFVAGPGTGTGAIIASGLASTFTAARSHDHDHRDLCE